MKPAHFIPPAIALILIGSWVGPQRQSLAAVETECARLRTTIAAANSPSSSANSAPSDPLEKRRKTIEWTKLAAHFPSNPMMSSGQISFGALPDPRVGLRFRQRLEAMSTDEIIATLDEIAALDLPAEARENLEWTLLDALARKDPELGLKLLEDPAMMESYVFRNLIAGALQAWAKQDSAAADAWFNQQIAAGKFTVKSLDGVNHSRQMFESALISILLTSSPESAARRLAALPEDQRGNVLRMYSLTTVPEENQVAHARLIRSQVSAKDQAATIAAQARFPPRDYSEVTAYLDRIDATPAERAACALRASENMNPMFGSNQLTREDIDSLREWVETQAPDTLAVVTGKALGSAAQGNRGMEFATAAELAVEYSTASGNDEVLATFLTHFTARSNKPAARVLAEKISDEKRRAEVLTFLK